MILAALEAQVAVLALLASVSCVTCFARFSPCFARFSPHFALFGFPYAYPFASLATLQGICQVVGQSRGQMI